MTIMNRIHSLARTLGSSYFSMDILEPTAAAGENVLDPESHRDVTPERFLKLEKEIVRGKAEVVCYCFSIALDGLSNFFV